MNSESRLQRLQMLREVALRADNFQNRAQRLGHAAARALTESKRSQITGLESIANSALKVTDVYDFVKLRTARQSQWREDDWGPELLDTLSNVLRKDREEICETLHIASPSHEALDVHLMLIREFVRQLSAHYEYACKYPDRREV